MLRKIRLTCGIICLTLITLLFLDFTGTLHGWFGWLAKIQFLPAVLALNVGVVVLLIILTGVFGRIYCSVICPLGVFQDVAAWIGKKRKKLPYSYSPALSLLRYGGIGNIHHHPGGRSKFHRNSICSLQCLRAYRKQPVPTHLAVGKQPVRPFSRTGRQLCILRSRHLDKKSAYFHCSRSYFCHPDIIGMAERTHFTAIQSAR